MAKRNRPRRGSLAYKPRKRAKKQTPRTRSWAASEEAKPLGFAGYKAGMTHVMAVDNNKNSSTSGLEVFIPVTIIDTPPMRVIAVRAYRKGYLRKETETDVLASNLGADIKRKVSMPEKIDTEKGLKEIEENIDKIRDIRLVVQTQPRLTTLEKKKPDIMEIALGGETKDKLEFAKKTLGKEITMDEVFTKNNYIDVMAVTKGKGYEGVIKRIGTRIQPRKTGKGRRHGGTGGAWTPARKLWLWPLPGQLGYHTRTEYNKLILDIGKEGKEITPKGGFINYGSVGGQYVLLYGSVPGPSKRLIRLNASKRSKKTPSYEITQVDQSSKQGL
ncbi:MAG: 50S ribosomal protein L3 [Candidatus Altiarchaeota archaeon]|nr:50S ribosomal protein L3 [Candidatus Altiarchaeota archaeon]